MENYVEKWLYTSDELFRPVEAFSSPSFSTSSKAMQLPFI